TGPHTQSLCVRGGSDRPLCQFALNVLSQLDESGDMTAERIAQATRWRRHLHQIPGTEFDVGETADFVARTCTDLGWEVTTGIGGSGVVASLTRGTSPRSIALRADVDGLPIEERTGAAHASKNIGAMHACGHNGHMAMVLGAASALAADIAFDGTVRLVFQPAEEPGTGAEAMIADGLFDRFAIDEIYGLHNIPGLPAGEIHTRCGPIMAAEDNFEISITGRGGHASAPHFVIDPMVMAPRSSCPCRPSSRAMSTPSTRSSSRARSWSPTAPATPSPAEWSSAETRGPSPMPTANSSKRASERSPKEPHSPIEPPARSRTHACSGPRSMTPAASPMPRPRPGPRSGPTRSTPTAGPSPPARTSPPMRGRSRPALRSSVQATSPKAALHRCTAGASTSTTPSSAPESTSTPRS